MILAFVLSLALAAVAFAEALVVVEVRTAGGQAVDGRVSLSGPGGSFSCQTSGGGCRIEGVPGGRYTVSFTSSSGQSTSRPAVIPPEGRVTLHVAAP
ncbi:MAG: hypothetical protein AAF938_05575 [Myxococcota bacterium]